jgi:hypothetical protein
VIKCFEASLYSRVVKGWELGPFEGPPNLKAPGFAGGYLLGSVGVAYTATVIVAGANGANGFGGPGQQGGDASATAAATDPSNTATATGGAGGSGYYSYGGGAGGTAAATASTTLPDASRNGLANASAQGGSGGAGWDTGFNVAGDGGFATADATLTATNGGAGDASASSANACGPCSSCMSASHGSHSPRGSCAKPPPRPYRPCSPYSAGSTPACASPSLSTTTPHSPSMGCSLNPVALGSGIQAGILRSAKRTWAHGWHNSARAGADKHRSPDMFPEVHDPDRLGGAPHALQGASPRHAGVGHPLEFGPAGGVERAEPRRICVALGRGSGHPSMGEADHLVGSNSHRVHRDTPEPSLLKPHGESQISRCLDRKGSFCWPVSALPNESDGIGIGRNDESRDLVSSSLAVELHP